MSLRESACLTMRDARKHGLLRQLPGAVKINLGIAVFAETPAQNVIRLYLPLHLPVSIRFPLSDSRFWETVKINVVFKMMKFGHRPYFICPVSKSLCLKLYIYKDIISSKQSFQDAMRKSEGFSQSSLRPSDIETRARFLGLKKTRLSTQQKGKVVKKARALVQKDADVAREFEKLQESEAIRRERFFWESRELSTTAALECGKGLADFDPFLTLARRDESWFSDVSPAVDTNPSMRPGLVTEFGELDIRVLLSRGIFGADRLTGMQLGWGFSRLWQTAVLMFVRPRDGELPQLIMEVRHDEAEPLFQDICLTPGHRGPGPRHFICPITRQRTDVLYFRDGFFASRQAHCLSYPPGGKRKFIQILIRENEKLSPLSRR